MFTYIFFPMLVYFPFLVYKFFIMSPPISCKYYYVKTHSNTKPDELVLLYDIEEKRLFNDTSKFIQHTTNHYLEPSSDKIYEYDDIMKWLFVRIHTYALNDLVEKLESDPLLKCTCDEYMNLMESDSGSEHETGSESESGSDSESDYEMDFEQSLPPVPSIVEEDVGEKVNQIVSDLVSQVLQNVHAISQMADEVENTTVEPTETTS